MKERILISQEKGLISHFKGIVIYILAETTASSDDKEIASYVMVRYWNYKALYNRGGGFVSGDELPEKQEKLLQAWFILREEEIRAAEMAWLEEKEIIVIDGLK